ncbi:MAG: hypothetical protein R2699_11150 [Acidimicrobiales bacterium]
MSWFVGWTGDELAAADDDAIADLHATLHRWADVLAGQGLATLLGTLRAETGVAARPRPLRRRPGHDRPRPRRRAVAARGAAAGQPRHAARHLRAARRG